MSTTCKFVVVLILAVLLAACESLQYYSQAVTGQLYILSHRKPITRLLRDPQTSPALKAKLESIGRINAFAESRLQLPLGSNYSTYVDLQRQYVVWNVFAAPEFSLRPLAWCYPIAGCVSYRGYFNEQTAQEFAEDLKLQGLDVFVGGVAAYSTLGWFADPVLNTIINRDEHQLAGLIFHELAHQVVFIPGETEFNESFATTVEREGLQRWLDSMDAAPAVRDQLLVQINDQVRRQEQFVALVQGAVADLNAIYARPLADADKRLARQQRVAQLRDDYETLKTQWQGYTGYDAWFARDLNNAQLATVVTYNRLVPAFTAMLREANGDLPIFYQHVKQLKQLDAAERQQKLQRLMPQ